MQSSKDRNCLEFDDNTHTYIVGINCPSHIKNNEDINYCEMVMNELLEEFLADLVLTAILLKSLITNKMWCIFFSFFS